MHPASEAQTRIAVLRYAGVLLISTSFVLCMPLLVIAERDAPNLLGIGRLIGLGDVALGRLNECLRQLPLGDVDRVEQFSFLDEA